MKLSQKKMRGLFKFSQRFEKSSPEKFVFPLRNDKSKMMCTFLRGHNTLAKHPFQRENKFWRSQMSQMSEVSGLRAIESVNSLAPISGVWKKARYSSEVEKKEGKERKEEAGEESLFVEEEGEGGREREGERKIGKWLLVVAGMTFFMVSLGGVTRLTNSGLSMVEWKLVKEVIPPITEEQWRESFEKYKQFPEYLQNKGMSLEEYKKIFFWEWAHRLWGRLIGVAFGVPLLYFAVRGRVKRKDLPKLSILFVLGGMQGMIGWWMVKSGLDHNLISQKKHATVSHYRLAVHLGSAFLLYSALVWFSLGFQHSQKQTH